jgi:predicted RNA binding protein YcfA (HicA-like mRNA interferase family)
LRLPRDVSGDDLAKALADLEYRVTRQTGSHLRLTTLEHGEHHVTIPRHAALRVGTLAGLLGDVAQHLALTREDLGGVIEHRVVGQALST